MSNETAKPSPTKANPTTHSNAKVKALFKQIMSVVKDVELPCTIELVEKQWLCMADHHWLCSMLKDQGIKTTTCLDFGWNVKEITILERA